MAQIKEKDTEFAEIYFNQILGSNDLQIAPQGEEKYLIGFTHFKEVRKLYDTIQNIYAIFDPIESDFKTSFKYFKYYFPEKPTPKVTTFISEFSLGNFIYGENNLAVGLDFYLGSNFPYQQKNLDQFLCFVYLWNLLVVDWIIGLPECQDKLPDRQLFF